MSIISWSNLLEKLLEGEELTPFESKALMSAWLDNELVPVQTGAFLAALRGKQVSGNELSSMASVLREACNFPLKGGKSFMVDTCGTGGDGADTFNISTAVAFVSASCGITIAKHGNRSASGKVGSADVLEGLGLKLDAPLELVSEALEKIQISFLFAPVWHSSLAGLAPLRKKLGVRTVFNLLGPLVNPFRPQAQVLGVAKAELLDPMAQALKNLGLERAIVIHGAGGLDEGSLEGLNQVRFLENGQIKSDFIDVKNLGLTPTSNEELKGGNLSQNIDILRAILEGRASRAQKEVVALNTALVFWASGKEMNLREGIKISMETLDSCKPWDKFNELKTFLE